MFTKVIKTLIPALAGLIYSTHVIAHDVKIPAAYEGKISALVLDAKTGKTIYSHDANDPRLVAPNMKLVTTLIALNGLKPDFKWHTKLAYSGTIEKNTLNGNVYLIGGGDPTLDSKAMSQIFTELKNLNINTINGNIIIDNSIFNSKPEYSLLKEEHFDSDTVLPDGLVIDGNLSQFKLLFNKANKISLRSNLYDYQITNQLMADDNLYGCTDLANKIKIDLDNKTVNLSGNLSPDCDGQTASYNMVATKVYTPVVISKTLNNLSLKLDGDIKYGSTPVKSTLVDDHTSQDLRHVLIDMNHYSINLDAETILLSLGAYLTNNDNTYKNSKQIYIAYMKKNNLLNPQFKLENGAGLSRTEYMTATAMAHLLKIANNSPIQADFQASLPRAGQSGTLKDKFIRFGKRAQFKTGTLNDTKSYAGYFYSTKGKKYIIVATANDIDTNNPSDLGGFNSWVNSLLNRLN